jgi:hypothetical protein
VVARVASTEMNSDPAMPESVWLRPPEDLVEIGFERSRVVMMNEAHDGLRRCIRTREVGRRVIPAAHRAGVRHIAMEALWSRDFLTEGNRTQRVPEWRQGYLSQPEMRALIQDGLDLGWTLVGYEADMDSPERPSEDLMNESVTKWREQEQARKLAAALNAPPSHAPLLVWCGNSHLSKASGCEWTPMGFHFRNLCGFDAFAIDQTVTVAWSEDATHQPVVRRLAGEVQRLGGTGGFLLEERRPLKWTDCDYVDAVVLSLENELI